MWTVLVGLQLGGGTCKRAPAVVVTVGFELALSCPGKVISQAMRDGVGWAMKLLKVYLLSYQVGGGVPPVSPRLGGPAL